MIELAFRPGFKINLNLFYIPFLKTIYYNFCLNEKNIIINKNAPPLPIPLFILFYFLLT